ncbi:MAG: GNAT family N-acetyltransferase [Actinomycetota bacterium]
MLYIERIDSSEVSSQFLDELRGLLLPAFGEDFSIEDWLHGLGGTHVCVRQNGVLVSHAAVIKRQIFIEDQTFRTGYVENMATLIDHQSGGFGRAAILEANKIIAENFELGALSSSSNTFYEKFGWENWEGPSYVVTNGNWIRSESEDDSIMILRTSKSQGLDLRSRIACEERLGDSW